MATTLRLGSLERKALMHGALKLGVELDESAADRLEEFAGLLDTWSAKTNLISCSDARELVDRHILDSLALARHVAPGGRIVDLGSGAGFPGVPLAVIGTDVGVFLVEARRRRANFLRAVKRQLRLDHVEVLEQRAELGPPVDAGDISTVVCRAVWSDAEIFGIAGTWLGRGGRLLWMRTEPRGSEPMGGEFEKVGVREYSVGTAGARAIHVFVRA